MIEIISYILTNPHPHLQFNFAVT